MARRLSSAVPRLVLLVPFASKEAQSNAAEYLISTLGHFRRREQANGGTTLLSSRGDVALFLHTEAASTLFGMLQRRGPRVPSLCIIDNEDDEEDIPLPPSRSIFSSFSTNPPLVSNTFTGAGTVSTSFSEEARPLFFVKEISVPCCASETTYHNAIVARNAFSAVGDHLPGIYRNEHSLCHIRLIPSNLFALTLRVDSIHSFKSSAMNKLGGDQFELVNSLPFSLRVTESDCILPWHVEGREAVLEGTEPKLQSKRVMSTTDEHIQDARMNHGNCWEEVRVIAKQPQKHIGSIRSEMLKSERLRNKSIPASLHE
jgi:hypothetical protein